jgi:hypothetical protein
MFRSLSLILWVLLVTGCGAKQNGFDGSDGALKDAGTSRVEWTIEITKPDSSYTSVGVIDFANHRGELVSNGKEIPGAEMRSIFIGRDIYLGLNLQGKMRWLKDSYNESPATDRFVPGPGGTSPDRLLEMLIKSSRKVEILGKDEIRGVPAAHYRAHLDEKKFGEEGLFSPADLIIDAWIDDDRLVRRVHAPYDQDVFVRVDLFDFGVPVEVEAPPADEIVDDDEFWGLLETWCMRRPKGEESQFCAVSAGTGITEGEIGEDE